MTAWLTESFLGAARTEFADVVGPPGLDGVVAVEVTGGPDGDVAVQLVFAGGRLTGADIGTADAAATLTVTAEDARAMVAGDLDPSVAFMQGRMKVSGEMALVLDLLATAATEDARAARARLAGSVTA